METRESIDLGEHLKMVNILYTSDLTSIKWTVPDIGRTQNLFFCIVMLNKL